MAKISAFLAILIFAAALIEYASPKLPRRDARDSEFSKHGGLLYYGSDLFTGVQIRRYNLNNIFQELQFVDGHLEGESREFAIGHKLTAIWNYHNGLKDGWQRGWFEEGPKRFEKHFQNGVLDGEQTEWHIGGETYKWQNYVDGVETDRKILFENGAIFSNYAKRDGRTYGIDGGALCMQKKPEGEK